MQTTTTPMQMDTVLGPLFVSVTAAKNFRHYDVDQREDVNILRPRLYVSTNTQFEGDADNSEHWTLRGRPYSVLRLYNFLDLTHLRYNNGSDGGRWHAEDNPHGGGYRNPKNRTVEARTPAHDLMDATVLMTLDTFATQYPQWGELSNYLRCKAATESTDLQIWQAQKEIDGMRKLAAQQQSETDEAFRRAPNDLLALVKN